LYDGEPLQKVAPLHLGSEGFERLQHQVMWRQLKTGHEYPSI
jgi:hypothetical protein